MMETKIEATTAPEKAAVTIYLMQVSCDAERQILEQWIRTNSTVKTESLTLRFPQKQWTVVPPELGPRLDNRNDNPLLAPLRVAWLPKTQDGRRGIRPLDLLLIGDPRRPRNYAKKLIAKRQPDRFKVLLGEPARLSDLRKAWKLQAAGDKLKFRPCERMIPALVERLRTHKADLLALLNLAAQRATDDAGTLAAVYTPARRHAARLIRNARLCGNSPRAVALRDAWNERVAICTIDGGLRIEAAELVALDELKLGVDFRSTFS